MSSVAIIGAGLVGTLAALSMAKQGHAVTLFDLRPDPRTVSKNTNLKSINLAISARGIEAMRAVDLEMAERLISKVIPMHGRMIHSLDGTQNAQLYGLFGEHINSIDRNELNVGLLDEIDKFNENAANPITLRFGYKLAKMDLRNDQDCCLLDFRVHDEVVQSFKFDFVIGADGSYSQTRAQLGKYVRMDLEQKYIDKCYLELYIPPTKEGDFALDKGYLHIWPRNEFMLIALANQDGSFTSTFFGPWGLTESLNERDSIAAFFRANFPDAVALMGLESIVKVFTTSKRNPLMQIACSPYHYEDKCIIIGDAAHSMVPFYGQGMNCGFEDVRILSELLKKAPSRAEAFQSYTQNRSQDLRSILKLALDNYNEMSSHVTSSLYLFRKTLDGVLGRMIPAWWVPMYTMVSFRADISYTDCILREKRQDRILKAAEAATVGALALAAWLKFSRR